MPPGESVIVHAAAVRAAVAAAAERVGRAASSVGVIAVTKTLPPDAVQTAFREGFQQIGENYVQEARAKRPSAPGGVWHLIGGLQRNKVRAAVATFDCIQTIDAVPVAEAVSAEVARAGGRLPVLLQVNAAGDAAKRGVAPEGVLSLAEATLRLPALRLQGLMTIPAVDAEPERLRAVFRQLRELRDLVAGRLGVELPHLSMGMSNDFMIAIEEGATMVRLGRALFGPRDPRTWREDS